jgi:chemotaxis protein MotA
MDKGTVIGLVVGFGALLTANYLEGGEFHSLLNLPAFLIVIGGTLGATLISFPLERVLRLPKLIALTFFERSTTEDELIEQFVHLAGKARREGLLSLEAEIANIKDPFIQKGLQLVVDGIDPEMIREILENHIHAAAERHEHGYSMLEAMGGYAPTMGIIGTVMGLIHVLSSLEDPSKLGGAIAVAFIATLYGVWTANLIWLPLGARLKAKSRAERAFRGVALEGILSVQAGDNPRIVREKLGALLPRHARGEANAASPSAQQSPAVMTGES